MRRKLLVTLTVLTVLSVVGSPIALASHAGGGAPAPADGTETAGVVASDAGVGTTDATDADDGDKPPGNETTTDGATLANTGTPCQFLAPAEYLSSSPPNFCHVLGNQSSEGNLRVMVADGLLATQRYSDGAWVRQFYTYSGAVIVVDGEKTSLGYYNSNPSQPDPTGSFWGTLPDYEAPVSQSISNDGRTVTTVWQVDGLEIRQDVVLSSDSDQFYRLDWEITNEGGGTAEDVHFLRGEDTYLAGGDFGNGFWNGGTNTVGVTKTVDGVQQRLSFQGITDPAGYHSAFYATVISDVESGSLDDTVNPSFHDNGYALEWQRNALSPGNTWTIRSVESFARSSLSVSGGGTQTLDGTSGTFGLNVSNFGQDPLAVSYTVDCPTGISCTTPPDETIDPGATSEVSVTAEASDNLSPGSYEVVLTANADGVPAAQGIGVLTVDETDDTDDPVVESRFDTDTEGWTVVGDAQGGSVAPDHEATGGNPGGHIVADDDVAGGTWYWNAPDEFLGDKSGAYGRTLSYDLRVSATDSQFSNDDVILEGDGTTLVYDHGDASTHPGTDWTHYEVRLDESAGWTVESTGAVPTRSQFQSVLSSLSALQIRGEYRDGSDTGRLDNAVLVTRDTTVTLQPANASVAPGGTTSVDVVVDGIDDGVGSYVLTVNSTDTSIVTITGAADRIGGSPRTDVAADGSSVRVGSFVGDTAQSGPVTVATVDLAADSSAAFGSTADLTLSITSVSDESGNEYTITDSTGATVTVEQVGPEVVPGSPARDPDNDGLYEDVNGDGDATPGDATVLFNAVFDGNPAVMDNVPLFDFNGDGDATPGDATALFNEIFG